MGAIRTRWIFVIPTNIYLPRFSRGFPWFLSPLQLWVTSSHSAPSRVERSKSGGNRGNQRNITLHLQLPRFKVLKCVHVAELQPTNWPEPWGISTLIGQVDVQKTKHWSSWFQHLFERAFSFQKLHVLFQDSSAANNLPEFHSISENGHNTFALKSYCRRNLIVSPSSQPHTAFLNEHLLHLTRKIISATKMLNFSWNYFQTHVFF